MSVIKVWNGDGRWSEAISGLDKVYFIKAAILSAYAPEDRWMSSGYEDCLSGFELNGQTISPDELDGDSLMKARKARQSIFERMEEVRRYADLLEMHVNEKIWPFPSYIDLMFGI